MRAGAFLDSLGPIEQARQRGGIEPVEDQHLGAAEHRGVELEARILGGRADQGDGAVLDIGQEAVLLRAVEPVDLVHEQERAPADPGIFLRLGEHLLQVGDAREDRADRDEAQAHRVGEQAGDRGLAGAGRAPEDDRRELARRHHPPDRALGPRQMLLPHDILEPLRAQAIGERAGRAFGGARRLFLGREKISHRRHR